MRAHFVFEIALMQAQTLGESQTDPRLILDSPQTHQIPTKLTTNCFKNVTELEKVGTIVEPQLDDIAAHVHQNV